MSRFEEFLADIVADGTWEYGNGRAMTADAIAYLAEITKLRADLADALDREERLRQGRDMAVEANECERERADAALADLAAAAEREVGLRSKVASLEAVLRNCYPGAVLTETATIKAGRSFCCWSMNPDGFQCELPNGHGNEHQAKIDGGPRIVTWMTIREALGEVE